MKERERESEREEEELLGRIRRIEEEDRAEREIEREKRRNIVIKGIDWNEGSNEGTVKEFIREKMKVGAGVERKHMIRVGVQKHNNSGDDEIDGGKSRGC